MEHNKFTTNFQGRKINILGVQSQKLGVAEISVTYKAEEKPKKSYLQYRESRLHKLHSVQSDLKSRLAEAVREAMQTDSKSNFFGKDKSLRTQIEEQPRSIYLAKHPKGVILHKMDRQSRNQIYKGKSEERLLESSRSQVSLISLSDFYVRKSRAIQVNC